jgi:hypothetical protein
MVAEKIHRRRQTKKGKELKYRQRTVDRWKETAEREGWKKRGIQDEGTCTNP